MPDISDLILTLTPEDGSSIGNGAMLALLREQIPELSDDNYVATRDALIGEGVLGRGKGRGGSIFRVTDDLGDEDGDLDEDEGDEDDGFELTHTEEAAPRMPRTKAGKKVTRRPDGPVQVLSYRHGETRVNNPEVGMVHAGTDPDGDKTVWAYDPHLDPVLNFDSARAGIERLIDDALASDDPERMKDALQELKRLQAPYLNWTGKAERSSVAVDTVSLHVHERVDPATILANASSIPSRETNYGRSDVGSANVTTFCRGCSSRNGGSRLPGRPSAISLQRLENAPVSVISIPTCCAIPAGSRSPIADTTYD